MALRRKSPMQHGGGDQRGNDSESSWYGAKWGSNGDWQAGNRWLGRRHDTWQSWGEYEDSWWLNRWWADGRRRWEDNQACGDYAKWHFNGSWAEESRWGDREVLVDASVDTARVISRVGRNGLRTRAPELAVDSGGIARKCPWFSYGRSNGV